MEKLKIALGTAIDWSVAWYNTTTKNGFYIPYAVAAIVAFILGAAIF